MSAATSQIRVVQTQPDSPVVTAQPSDNEIITAEPKVGRWRRLLRFLRHGAWEVKTYHNRPGSDSEPRHEVRTATWTPPQVMACVIPTVGLIVLLCINLLGYFGNKGDRLVALETRVNLKEKEYDEKLKELKTQQNVVNAMNGLDPVTFKKVVDAIKRGEIPPEPDPSK